MARQTELLKGTLDLLFCACLNWNRATAPGRHCRTNRTGDAGGTFVVKPGSLFPALHRLEQQGFIDGGGTCFARQAGARKNRIA